MFTGMNGAVMAPDGSFRPVALKGGSLYETFYGEGTRAKHTSPLSGSKEDLGRAYTLAVWAYRCIKLRSDAVAGVKLRLLDANGSPILTHPLLDLIKDVNPMTMNLGDLLRATEASLCIWGVSYWLKTSKPGAAKPSALYWLNPTTIEVETDPLKGVIRYTQRVNGEARHFAPEELVVFRNFNPLDDLGGLSPLSVALNEINAELNAARFVSAFFANDARPAGLLTTDQMIGDAEIERTRSWWSRLFRGAENRWKTGIVGGGLRWSQITFAPEELALPDLRAEDRRAICAVFGVPAGMAGAWEAVSYATAREQKAGFYEDTILPQLEYLAEVLNWSLLSAYPELSRRGARLAWDVDGIAALSETRSAKSDRLLALYAGGLITREEARRELGLMESPARGEHYAGAPEPVSGGPTLKEQLDEIDTWERFVTKRLKAAVPLRPFEAEAIPPELHKRMTDELKWIIDVEKAAKLFESAREELRGGGMNERCA